MASNRFSSLFLCLIDKILTSKPQYLVFDVVSFSSMATFLTLLRVIVLGADRLLDFSSGKAGPWRISTTQLMVLKQVL